VKRLWLDDIRPPPPSWTWVKTTRWAISELYTQSYEMVSLDYDLDRAPNDPAKRRDDLGPGDDNGYEVLGFLENKAYNDPTFFIPRVFIHTTNPIAFVSMHLTLRAMKRETGKG